MGLSPSNPCDPFIRTLCLKLQHWHWIYGSIQQGERCQYPEGSVSGGSFSGGGDGAVVVALEYGRIRWNRVECKVEYGGM